MLKFVPELRVWYRSAMTWFLAFYGVMETVQWILPQVQDYLPDGWYGKIQVACIVCAGIARYIKQNGLRKALVKKEAKEKPAV